MNSAQTLRTDLNVVSEKPPAIPVAFQDSQFVFLANTHPALQRGFIAQLKSPKLIVCDTMNLWIGEFHDELIKTLGQVHGVGLNDGEITICDLLVTLSTQVTSPRRSGTHGLAHRGTTTEPW